MGENKDAPDFEVGCLVSIFMELCRFETRGNSGLLEFAERLPVKDSPAGKPKSVCDEYALDGFGLFRETLVFEVLAGSLGGGI